MNPFRERARRRPLAWLLRIRPSLRHQRRQARQQRRSAREFAIAVVAGLTAGVALEFFLDPRGGKRRRRLVRDRTRGAFRRRARRVERQAHYEAGKIVGFAHTITHREQAPPEMDDVGLVRKVESELFRDRTLPKGQISINADRGIVVLRGQLENVQQIERIERAVRKVAGVHDVENLLHPPTVPAPASKPHGNPRTGHGRA